MHDVFYAHFVTVVIGLLDQCVKFLKHWVLLLHGISHGLPFLLSFIFKAGPISSFQLNFCSDSDNKVLEIGYKLKYYEYSLYQHLVFMTE